MTTVILLLVGLLGLAAIWLLWVDLDLMWYVNRTPYRVGEWTDDDYPNISYKLFCSDREGYTRLSWEFDDLLRRGEPVYQRISRRKTTRVYQIGGVILRVVSRKNNG